MYKFVLCLIFHLITTHVLDRLYLQDSGDPDVMPHNAEFRQGLHCLIFKERNTMLFDMIICHQT